ncbi:MAG: arginyltransferase [Verrucomicrobiales bacterium]
MNPASPPKELLRFKTEPKACNYLPAEVACMDYKAIVAITPEQYLAMLSRGWRRFGILFFRPACGACARCISLRIPLAAFKPGHSQRRTLSRNKDIELVVQPASCSADHIELFNRYHAFMHQERGWPEQQITPREYVEHFLGPFSFAKEFLYFKEGKLVGVGLVDLLPGATSSVYFYHDPEWRKEGPGVYSMLRELEIGRKAGAEFNYLGYWLQDCPSMAYKAQFKPHQLLHGFPADDEMPNWGPAQPGD